MIRYKIMTDKPSVLSDKERRTIHGAYLIRKEAAKLYKFSPEAGKKIHALRLQYFKEKPEQKHIIDPKYNVKLPFVSTPLSRLKAIRAYRQQIKDIRNELRALNPQLSQTGFDENQKIHVKPNGVFNWFYQKMLGKLKRPTTSAMYIGIEIECGVPADMEYTLFTKWVNTLSVGGDSSIQELPAGYVSREFRLLTTINEYQEDVKEILGILNAQKAVVNNTCGLHIHLDMRQWIENSDKIKQQYINLVKSQKYLQQLVLPERIHNSYCQENRELEPYELRGRYWAINASSLTRHNTIEIRLHHGSLDVTEITNWITLLLSIISAETIKRTPAKLKLWLDKLTLLPAPVKDYIRQKIESRPMPVINPDLCTRAHDGETCFRCGERWDDLHEGHNCLDEDGNESEQRGVFDGCTQGA